MEICEEWALADLLDGPKLMLDDVFELPLAYAVAVKKDGLQVSTYSTYSLAKWYLLSTDQYM